MRVVIVGGGKVGGHLARELRQLDHGVILIEQDPARATRLAEESDALVVNGDGCDIRLLEDAGAARADFFVAVTGHDEDNLVACQLVRTAFGQTRLVARVNDPRNRPTFEALGVPVVSVTDTIARLITQELDFRESTRVALFERGQLSLIELEIPMQVTDRPVRDLPLPASTILISVTRDDEVAVPGPDTLLQAGDHVLAVTRVEHEDEVRAALLSPTPARRAGESRD